jgi:hypothetical protein
MNCTEVRQHWNLYHDSEGDADLHFRISEHLAVCPQCAQWFSQQSRLERLLAAELRACPPTRALWDQVLSRCGLKRDRAARRWSWVGVVAATAVFLVAAYVVRPLGSDTPDLARLSAEWHQRLEGGEEEPQFHSQSDLEVERFLRQRVAFPVRCPPRKDAGFAVQGAGVCQLANQPAAYLSGHVDAAQVSIIVLPRESLTRFPRQREAIRLGSTLYSREGPYQVAMSVIDRNAVMVVGQADARLLDRVLRAYGTYPDEH